MEPQTLDTLWFINSRTADLAESLKRALKKTSIAEELAALAPDYPEYEGLKKALALYTRLKEKQPEWPALPQELVLKPGDSSRYVAQLRKRLHITGEYTGDTVLDDSLAHYYDTSLAEAVADYQQRNGLEVDSIVAGETLGMLNIPVDKRLKQIRLNLERLRWMPERPKGRHIRVNVPEFKLYVYEGEEEVMNMRVVVGKAYESFTPIFNDSIEYISFSPTWTVPTSIATQEMLPKIMEDPSYLSRNGYTLYEGWEDDAPEIDPRKVDWEEVDTTDFPYRIVQNPGGSNALGQMKFMFPNNLSIYLHDTPAGHLFENTERDYSHGCVRIEKPMDLAEYLLEGKGWRKSKIQQHLDLEEPENVMLPEKVPVFIEYRTAWLDEEGKVNFREDIYGHDKRQSEQLERLLSEAYNETLLALQARYQ
jgi:murein L,D-transpeptidase YcbB/YkuD